MATTRNQWARRNPNAPRRDLYAEITNRIVDALETGVAPWKPAWTGPAGGGLPVNGLTRNHYAGVNILLLWLSAMQNGFLSSEWYTFRQAKQACGFRDDKDARGRTRWVWTAEGDPPAHAGVRTGEKGTTITFWRTIERKDAKEGESDKIPIIRHFTVFNRSQIDGLPPLEAPVASTCDAVLERNARAEALFAAAGVQVTTDPHGNPRYNRVSDVTYMPPMSYYDTAEAYYVDLAHEGTHWTGHESRLARDMEGRFGSDQYAMEELVAEMGSAFVCAHLGLQGLERDHASYLACWIRRLKSDNRLIFSLTSAARQAAEYLGATGKDAEDGLEDEATTEDEPALAAA